MKKKTLYNIKWFAIGWLLPEAGPEEERSQVAIKSLSVLIASLILLSGMVLFSGMALGQGTQPPPAKPENAPPASDKPSEAPKTLPNSVTPDNTGAPIDPHTYVIGPEDVLYVQVWREPELTRAVGVRPDGKITMPLIGDMQASGLTPERFGAQLKQALSDRIINPDVTITVVQVNSKRYTITGGVNRPGPYPLALPTHVFEALSNAGGFKDFANKKKIIIKRGTQRIKFNYEEVLKGKRLDQDILLENGDIIYVPE